MSELRIMVPSDVVRPCAKCGGTGVSGADPKDVYASLLCSECGGGRVSTDFIELVGPARIEALREMRD